MPIRILVCDDIEETRDNIKRLLSLDEEMVVIGEACDGEEAISKTGELRPDVILMDINMPKLDGILATEEISVRFSDSCIIMLSVQGEQVYLKKAMLAGAKDYIVKPFSNEELINGIKRVHQLERRKKMKKFAEDKIIPFNQGVVEERKPEVLTVFNTKGGVGKSTIATNLSVCLQQLTNKRVVLLDFDLQFGDISAILNVVPKQTIIELVQDIDDLNPEAIERYLYSHKSTGIKILPAPLRPEFADLIRAEHIEKVVKTLKESYDYIIIDTAPIFNDINLSILDISDQILLVLALDLPTVKNTKLTLEVIDSLNYKQKTKIILNRSSDEVGLRCDDVERTLDMEIMSHIPSHGKIVVASLNKGVPFVISNPGTKITDSLFELAELVSDTTRQKKVKKGFLNRLFG